MKWEYRKWIRECEARYGGAQGTLGRCEQEASAMVKAFPELRLVKGHVYCLAPVGKRGHWWCEDSEGTVLDPTAGQFDGGILRYEEYQEGDPVRLGKCMNCGEEIWGDMERGRQTLCGEACYQAFASSL